MGLLVASVQKKSKVNAIRLLVEVYFIIQEIKFSPGDIDLLTYYILYGSNKGTDIKIRKDFYQGMPERKSQLAIWRIRSKLKKMGVLVQNVYTLALTVNPDLLQVFDTTDRLGAFIQFTYSDEL